MGFIVNLLVTFFLSPVVVNTLGLEVYGIWVVISTLTGYLGLVESGVTVSTGRFLNYYLGRKDLTSASETVSTSLVFYVAIGGLLLLLLLLLRPWIETLVPPTWTVGPGELFLICMVLALNVLLGFVVAVVGQLLQAENRFDLRNLCALLGVLLRFALTLSALNGGGGLLELAGVQAISTLFTGALMSWFALNYGPAVRISPGGASLRALRELFGFGKWAMVNNVCAKASVQADVLVVGGLLGVRSVAFYSVGQMLVEYSFVLVQSVVSVASPDLIKAVARGDTGMAKIFIIEGGRASICLAVPLFIGLMVFGSDFLRLWMGPEFEQGAAVASILAGARLLCALFQGAGAAIWALGHVKVLSMAAAMTTAINLLVSILLILLAGAGIEGVAVGTLVALFIQQMIVYPLLVRRFIGVSLTGLYSTMLPRFIAASAVVLLTFVSVEELVELSSWLEFIAVIVPAGLVGIALTALIVLGRSRVRRLIRRLITPAA
ncbi:MAG: oligosaccharide flippase family protein [Gammaproteobacteria bacterium]|nr:oligosaccharide flippase family protein [Gammaproteobacteria bacterium]